MKDKILIVSSDIPYYNTRYDNVFIVMFINCENPYFIVKKNRWGYTNNKQIPLNDLPQFLKTI